MTETKVSLQTESQPFIRQSRMTAQIQKMSDRKSVTTQNRSFAYRSFA